MVSGNKCQSNWAKGDIARMQKKSCPHLLSYSPGDSTHCEVGLARWIWDFHIVKRPTSWSCASLKCGMISSRLSLTRLSASGDSNWERACTGTAFWALVMSLSDRYLDWKNLCVNKILFNVVYSQNNMLLRAKIVILCVPWCCTRQVRWEIKPSFDDA